MIYLRKRKKEREGGRRTREATLRRGYNTSTEWTQVWVLRCLGRRHTCRVTAGFTDPVRGWEEGGFVAE